MAPESTHPSATSTGPTTVPGPHVDARVLRSRRRLGDALVRLTLERGYDAVTIRDVTDEAGIGYATFFRHYADKDALLRDLLDVVLAELMQRLEAFSPFTDAAKMGTMVFEHARDDADLYGVLLRSQHSIDLLPRALEVGMAGVLRTYRAKPGGIVPLDAAVNHLIRSFVALIDWWLANGMRPRPSEMGQVFDTLILGPTREAAFEALP